MTAAVVYRFTNRLNGKVYVGKTIDLYFRLWTHRSDVRRGSQLPFHRALRKYGFDGFAFEVVGSHATEAEANAHEIAQIAAVPHGLRYNLRPGGEGGSWLSAEQIDAQYTIGKARRDELRGLYDQGLTAREISRRMSVCLSAVLHGAKRFGFPFAARRSAAKLLRRQRADPTRSERNAARKREASAKREQARCQREEAAKAGPVDGNICPRGAMTRCVPGAFGEAQRARGATQRARLAELTPRILKLYFEDHVTAKDLAQILGVTRGTVRATVNKAYSQMSEAEHLAAKRAHGSAVRTGIRNTNAHLLRARQVA